jgi:hypothetical protein
MPTAAFAMRMRKITTGSTKALKGEASLSLSSKAKTNDMTADARRIRTSSFLNCSRISSHMGVPGSSRSYFVGGIVSTASGVIRGQHACTIDTVTL